MSVPEGFPADLAAELRALPIAAPAGLRERVRGLGEPASRRTPLVRPSLRRTLLVLAPACVLSLVAVAVVHGVLSSAKPNRPELAALPAEPLPAHGSAVGSVPLAPPQRSLVLPPSSPGRHQDYQADLRVRVSDSDALGRETAAAMRVTTELGGYVASVEQSSAKGTPGDAYLVLRVPVVNVERAMVRLSALGTVLDQHVSIVDLEQAVRAERDRIRELRVRIARITAALQQPLPADVKLRLQFQLDDARRALARATGAQRTTLQAAALSRIALTLTTQRAAATTTHRRGRFGNAVANAGDFLAAAGAIALLVLIVISPLLLLGLLFWYGARAWRRREERRLLAET